MRNLARFILDWLYAAWTSFFPPEDDSAAEETNPGPGQG